MTARKRAAGPPSVTMIVVTHNSSRWVRPCLDSLRRQRYGGKTETIVVDNDSTDRTRAILKSRFKDVKLIEAENRGFGAANNLAARAAKGTILAFANPDTVAGPDWLTNLIEPLTEPKTVTTSQILLLGQPDKVNTIGLDLHYLGFSFVRGLNKPAIDAAPAEVPGFSGAAFAIKRADYEHLGGFDEDIFLYGEDTEFSWRMRAQGYRILAVPRSRIQHNYAPRMDAQKLYHVELARQLLLQKHLSIAQQVLYAPARLTARLLVTVFARRYGRGGREAVRRARQETERTPKQKRRGTVLRFARRTIPVRTAFPESRLARWLGWIPNLVFLLNAPWIPARRRWLDEPR